MPWFWENFDHENYSIWYCEYMYPEELRLTFMSANLVGGMMQRLDKLRKYAFGAVAVFGSNNNSSISGENEILSQRETCFDLLLHRDKS